MRWKEYKIWSVWFILSQHWKWKCPYLDLPKSIISLNWIIIFFSTGFFSFSLNNISYIFFHSLIPISKTLLCQEERPVRKTFQDNFLIQINFSGQRFCPLTKKIWDRNKEKFPIKETFQNKRPFPGSWYFPCMKTFLTIRSLSIQERFSILSIWKHFPIIFPGF